jgi:DNA-binding MarR family transcriptional regulator
MAGNKAIMKNKTVELVNFWADFERLHPGASVDDFCRHHLAALEVTPESHEAASDKEIASLPIETKLARAVGRLTRFHASYARKVLADLDLNNLDDFLYLNTLRQLKTPKKSELIYASVSEFSSGTEIIRRLMNLGLVREFPDAEDRRSKRLKITPKGAKLLEKCYDKMQELNFMVYGTMGMRYKELAYSMFALLDRFHTEVYAKTRNKDLEETKKILGGR